MTTYVRPAASARDDADMIVGWNISPNTGYTLQLSVTASGAVVLLLSTDGSTLIGSGTTSIGAAQPVTVTPVSGQAVDMADPSLGWHLLLTTDGTEGTRSITLDPLVDLPARTNPVYADDGLSLAVATADINAGTHYTQDVVVSCTLGFVASVGDTASVPVDDVTVVGQVESITWSGTPDGATTQAVIREHIQIRPDAYVVPVPPTPPTVADDTATTDAFTATSGNVLTNDSGGTLTVSAVNDRAANVGQIVPGSNGGNFVINADGSWTFDTGGDFAALSGTDTATTSVTYHASNGDAEAMATLAVTVSSADQQPWTPAEITTALWLDAADSSTITLNGSTVSQWGDKSGLGINVTQGIASKQPQYIGGVIVFDGVDDYLESAAGEPSPFAELTMLVVWQTATPTVKQGVVTKRNPTGTGFEDFETPRFGVRECISGYDGKCDFQSWSSTSSTISTMSTAIQANTPVVDCISSSASTGHKWHRNGTLVVSTATANMSSAGKDAGNKLWIGASRLDVRFLNGFIAEIVLIRGVLDDATKYKAQGYLAHKWDALLGVTTLVDALPDDHPYKSAAPMI